MFVAIALAASLTIPTIVPKPASIEFTGGYYRIPNRVIVEAPEGAQGVSAYLMDWLKRTKTVASTGTRNQTIRMALDSSLTNLGDEGYTLTITKDGLDIRAPKPAGLFYGVQTFRQLLPASAERGRSISGQTISCMKIVDKPRFPWRGLHLDVSRHFFSVDEIKKYIDTMATFKFNVFHWHLTDDGGWRLEIKKYPKLTSLGGWRKGDGQGWDQRKIVFAENDGSSQVYGGSYTQEQVKEIVAYAAARNVTIVPEIEMPGHSMTVSTAYPEVGCDANSLKAWKEATGYDYSMCMCAGKERTFEFLKNVLDEVASLFPSKYIHIGGDELDKTQWAVCADCQRRKQTEGLKDEHELQSYFIKRVEGMLNSKNRTLIGWDEILEGGLAPNATVMSWRGISGGIEAAKAGHDVVMTPTSHCYFDYSYANISTEAVYGFEPIPDELTNDQGKHVLGAQGNLWTEWMNDFAQVERMAWPRAAALAEVAWSPKDGRRWIEFQGRLREVYGRLAALGVQFNIPAPNAKMSALIFADKSQVEFEPPALEGGLIRYTTDGSVPTEKSAVFKGPITISSTTDVRAATFLGNTRSAPTLVSCVKLSGSAPQGLVPGMSATVKLGRFSKVAEMANATNAKTALVSDFSLGVAGLDDGFGIVFSGFIRIPESGVYTFSTTSDDGSVLRIAGATVVDNDGLHGSVEATGKVFLPAGTYPFAVEFFEAGGAERLDVSVTPPNGPKGPIPTDWLLRLNQR